MSCTTDYYKQFFSHTVPSIKGTKYIKNQRLDRMQKITKNIKSLISHSTLLSLSTSVRYNFSWWNMKSCDEMTHTLKLKILKNEDKPKLSLHGSMQLAVWRDKNQDRLSHLEFAIDIILFGVASKGLDTKII